MSSDPARDALLRPSLSAERSPRQSPYSTTALFMTAFFGGPLAALPLWGINAYRLGRLTRDAAGLLLGVLACVATAFLLHGHCAAALCRQAADTSPSTVRLLWRVLALLVAGAASLLHRREHRAVRLMGQAAPNGTALAIALIVAGNLGQYLLEKAFE